MKQPKLERKLKQPQKPSTGSTNARLTTCTAASSNNTAQVRSEGTDLFGRRDLCRNEGGERLQSGCLARSARHQTLWVENSQFRSSFLVLHQGMAANLTRPVVATTGQTCVHCYRAAWSNSTWSTQLPVLPVNGPSNTSRGSEPSPSCAPWS